MWHRAAGPKRQPTIVFGIAKLARPSLSGSFGFMAKKKTSLRAARIKLFPLAGMISQGAPISRPRLRVSIPVKLIESHEVVFQVSGFALDALSIADGDLLIVEPRKKCATGELLIATLDGRAFVGRWWGKQGSQELRDDEWLLITDDERLEVLGAVTIIVRWSQSGEERTVKAAAR